MAGGRPNGLMGAGERLPPLVLDSATGADAVRLREPAAGAPVILRLPAEPEPWLEYARSLAADPAAYRNWSGRLIVAIAGDGDAASRAANALAGKGQPPLARVIVDPEGELGNAIRAPSSQAALVIADRWGLVYFTRSAESPEALPAPAEIEEWLRFLATQCPECGVPDEPGTGEMV
jgi:hypothetical protein